MESPEDESAVRRTGDIINRVRVGGDKALVELTRKFDSPSIKTVEDLRVSRQEIEKAHSRLDPAQADVLKLVSKQIASLARQQMVRFRKMKFKSPLGFVINERYMPFDRIGGYVPGGLASYPSTVLMICITARRAGIRDIILATPPRKDGSVCESILVAADICGVGEIIKAGGAQAVAAMAIGTESIRKVDLIAGPGNQYVTEAKRQLAASGSVLIDSLAGPTELLIIADENADALLVAGDLISQAEHGNRTLCGIASNSKTLLQKVDSLIRGSFDRPRQAQIRESSLFSVLVPSRSMLVEFAQRFAPEHLEVMLKNPENYEARLTNSGLVLTGNYTPCSSTDYVAGTNHILPTGGTARISSGLGVENFLKRVTSVTASRESLRRSSATISTIANMENLPNHSMAALSRFRSE
ncbi:MAG: histidinol dehydrogenase [Nitrososphaerales archaeon]